MLHDIHLTIHCTAYSPPPPPHTLHTPHSHPHTHRHHIGYVTLSQFRQCLSYLDLAASEAELKVMEVKYSDSKGFHYLTFLEHLSPNQPMVDKYSSRMTHLRSRKVSTIHTHTRTHARTHTHTHTHTRARSTSYGLSKLAIRKQS